MSRLRKLDPTDCGSQDRRHMGSERGRAWVGCHGSGLRNGVGGSTPGRGQQYKRRGGCGGRGGRVMSSVLEMLRLRCRWDFQFIFNTHENTPATPVPELCPAENINHRERD